MKERIEEYGFMAQLLRHSCEGHSCEPSPLSHDQAEEPDGEVLDNSSQCSIESESWSDCNRRGHKGMASSSDLSQELPDFTNDIS